MTSNNNKRPEVVSSNLDIKKPDSWDMTQMAGFIGQVVDDTSTTRGYQEDWYARYTTYNKPIDDMTAPDYMSDDPDAPDFRIHNAFEKEIVDNVANYLCSKEPDIKLPDDTTMEKFKTAKATSVFHGKLIDTVKYACATGTGALLAYQDKENIRMISLKGYEYYILYDDNGYDALLAIRFYCETVNTTDKYFAELYTKDKIYYFDGGNAISGAYSYKSDEDHYFGVVPIFEMACSAEEYPVFYCVRRLIDAYDRLISNYGNEMENFRHAIMVLINYSTDTADLSKLRKSRTIEITDDGDVKYLTKDINPEAFTVLKEIYEKNIERFSGTLNYSDPEVYGKATNLAISTRLKPLENNARALGIRAKAMLYRMFEGLSNFWSKTNNGFDWRAVEIAWNYDRPINELENVDIATKKQVDLGMAREDAWKDLDMQDIDEAIERAEKDKETQYGVDDETI